MRTYRMRPLEVQAFQMTPHARYHNEDWPQWLHEAWNKDPKEEGSVFPPDTPEGKDLDILCVHTVDGMCLIVPEQGDWVIQGINGEITPCKAENFRATYERVLG